MQTREEILRAALLLPESYFDQPFHDDNWTVVRHKKNRKIFAWIFERRGNTWVNLKTPPDWRELWRETYASVLPAYHLNKEHWNSVILDGSVPEREVLRMIELSYDLTK
ncbi:MAG: MmcQ/YjbR family DNA-binding protein [Clostridia bacterium]|jgi:predicted DNA-binding protein (MmcQ/YjbR family)|nr:MmcQ/YjbR family DNA-binding protein [Clostridia bacterium]